MLDGLVLIAQNANLESTVNMGHVRITPSNVNASVNTMDLLVTNRRVEKDVIRKM